MASIGDEFKCAVAGLLTPQEIKQLKAAKNAKNSDAGDTIGKAVAHIFEKDPKTGESRLVGFLEHLRHADDLAHNASGQVEDPQAVDPAHKLGNGLDSYLAFYDRALSEPSSSTDSDSDQTDGGQTEKSGDSADLSHGGSVLQDFVDGITAYGDYIDQSCGSTGGSPFAIDTKQ